MAAKKKVVTKSEPIKTEAKKAEPVVKAEPAVTTAPAKKEEVVKAEVKKEEPKKEETKKEEPKKVTPAKKTTKKTPAKKEVTQTVYVQFAGKEVAVADIMPKIKKVWQKAGNRVRDIKDVKLYVKPEDNKVYFVINDVFSDSVDFD